MIVLYDCQCDITEKKYPFGLVLFAHLHSIKLTTNLTMGSLAAKLQLPDNNGLLVKRSNNALTEMLLP